MSRKHKFEWCFPGGVADMGIVGVYKQLHENVPVPLVFSHIMRQWRQQCSVSLLSLPTFIGVIRHFLEVLQSAEAVKGFE